MLSCRQYVHIFSLLLGDKMAGIWEWDRANDKVRAQTESKRWQNWAKTEVCAMRASVHLHYDFFSIFFYIFAYIFFLSPISRHINKCRHIHG